MNDIEADGCYTLRGIDMDQAFASPKLSDRALTAACWTTAQFDASFPGWQLYRRITAGAHLFDRDLDAWAITTARLLARSRVVKTGKSYVSPLLRARFGWITRAARDGLQLVVQGHTAAVYERTERYGIHADTYLRIRDPIAAGLQIGLDTFRAELSANYFRARKTEMFDSGGMVLLQNSIEAPVDFGNLWYGPQSGNTWVNPTSVDTDQN